MRGFWPARNDISVKLNRDLFSIFVSRLQHWIDFRITGQCQRILVYGRNSPVMPAAAQRCWTAAGQADSTKPQKRD